MLITYTYLSRLIRKGEELEVQAQGSLVFMAHLPAMKLVRWIVVKVLDSIAELEEILTSKFIGFGTKLSFS